ncbi:glycerophosphodiester phosphodiesterase [Pararhodobacter sp.]
MTRPHPFLDHPRPIAIAHRGGSLEGEENTLPNFARAVAMGYTHLETDVHATRDGHVVIHHDPTLARMTGDPRAIADLTRDELRALRTPGGAGIPLLSELLETHPDTFVNIEAKSDAVVEPLAALLTRMNALDRIATGSFNPNRTRRLSRLLGPGLCYSPAHAGVLAIWLRGWGLPVPHGAFRVLQVPMRFRGIPVVTPRFLRAAHARDLQVQVWTVDDEDAMHELLDMGVDGLMTDRPALLKSVLQTRRQWRGRDA